MRLGTFVLLLMGAACSERTIPVAAEESAALSPSSFSASQAAGSGQVITILPRTDTIRTGDSLQLTAWATNPAGKTKQVSAGWASLDPSVATVDTAGVVIALTAGKARITANARGRSATAEVRVLPRGPAGASLVLSHDELTLTAGGSAVLGATVTDRSGSVVKGASVTWASTDPSTVTVDSSGTVTARRPGRANVTASALGQTRAARVHVTEDSPITMPGAGVAGPGEPPGFTLITDQEWTELPSHPANPWSWNPSENGTIVVDPAAPTPSRRAFRATVRKGTDGRGSHNAWYSFPTVHRRYSELYISVWYRFPKEWRNHEVGTKQLWPAYDGAINQLYTGFSQRSMRAGVNLQGQAWGNRNLRPNIGPASHHDLQRWRDQYIRLEYHVKMNTVDHLGGDRSRADGVVRVWMTAGGERHLIMNHDDVKFLSVGRDGKHRAQSGGPSTGKFTGIKWNPTYGGIGDPAPSDMTNYTAKIYVSGR